MLCCAVGVGPVTAFVAEDDVKKHYDVLMALDSVLEEPEITVTYK